LKVEQQALTSHYQGMTLTQSRALQFSLILVCLAATAAAAQENDGQLLFNNACRTCHSVKEGDNRLGPNLHRILGRKSGSLNNYPYSDSMAKSDLVWDKPTLDRFMANPDAVVRGNGMQPYGGMSSAEDRARIIAYLEKN
jgi:cytochrome c